MFSNYIVHNVTSSVLAVTDGNGILQEIPPFLTRTVFLDSSTAADLVARLGAGNVTATTTTFAAIAIGASTGPTITAGAGAPSGTQPNGSLYLRSGGGANTRIYISHGGGVWAALTGS